MKKSVFSVLLILLTGILIFISCSPSGGGSTKYDYCVYMEQKICLSGSYESCPNDGTPSNSCPLGFDKGESKSSSSKNIFGGSSSSVGSNNNNSSSSKNIVSSSSVGSNNISSASVNGGGYTGSYGSVEHCGQKYKTVVIGTQTWMAENLNCYVAGSVCYGNDPANCAEYGRLYNRSAAMSVCPSGWHLSNNTDWDNLVSYVENNSGCSSDCAGKHLKETSGWNENGNGSNKYGFSALPSGYGDPEENYFGQVGRASYYWEYYDAGGGGGLCGWSLAYDSDRLYSRQCKDVNRQFSVRCVKDNSVKPSSSSAALVPSSSSVASTPSSSSVYVPPTPSSSSIAKSSSSVAIRGDYCYYGSPSNCYRMPTEDNCKDGILVDDCYITAEYCDYGVCEGGSGWDCLISGGCYLKKSGDTCAEGVIVYSCPTTHLPPNAR